MGALVFNLLIRWRHFPNSTFGLLSCPGGGIAPLGEIVANNLCTILGINWIFGNQAPVFLSVASYAGTVAIGVILAVLANLRSTRNAAPSARRSTAKLTSAIGKSMKFIWSWLLARKSWFIVGGLLIIALDLIAPRYLAWLQRDETSLALASAQAVLIQAEVRHFFQPAGLPRSGLEALVTEYSARFYLFKNYQDYTTAFFWQEFRYSIFSGYIYISLGGSALLITLRGAWRSIARVIKYTVVCLLMFSIVMSLAANLMSSSMTEPCSSKTAARYSDTCRVSRGRLIIGEMFRMNWRMLYFPRMTACMEIFNGG